MQESALALKDVKVKLKSIMGSRVRFDQVLKEYKEAQNRLNTLSLLRKDLSNKMVTLQKKFNLSKPINAYISYTKNIKPIQIRSSAEILTTDIHLTFTTSSFTKAFAIIQEAYKLLPHYSIVLSVEISENTTMTPDELNLLNENIKSNIILAKVKMQTRNVKVRRNTKLK